MAQASSNNPDATNADASSFARADTMIYRSHRRHQIDGQGESQWLVVLVKLVTKKRSAGGIT
jgi:hypothetical protein